MFNHVLCPVDGSPSSIQALKTAEQLGTAHGARLTVCTVVDPARAAAMAFADPAMGAACFDALKQDASSIVEDALKSIAAQRNIEVVTLYGHPTYTITQYAVSRACDLIVIARAQLRGISGSPLRSIDGALLRRSSVPVLVIP